MKMAPIANGVMTPEPDLSPWERAVLACIAAAAEAGRTAPTGDELQECCGCESISTTVHLVQRLERKGLIRVQRYQRTRRITILATGKATAPVTNKTPHWRTRKRPGRLPSAALPALKSRRPDIAMEIIKAARREGMALDDFIAELVWAGWQSREEAFAARVAALG